MAVGPLMMMKAVCDVTRPFEVHTIVSLNSIMVDGTGMCGCCRVTVGGETKYACVDGPEFDGHKVDFAEAAAALFGLAEPERVVFCQNATHALNVAIKAVVRPGDRVVISGYEHNAVLRPLHALGAVLRVYIVRVTTLSFSYSEGWQLVL